MKNIQRLVAMLLVMALVVPMMPISAFATSEEEQEVAAAETVPVETQPQQTENEIPEETVQISGQIPVQINPLYADVLSAEELVLESAPVQLLTDPEYGTQAEAVAVLREGMKARASEVTVYVHTTSTDLESIFYDIFQSALAHTGVADEGDYLAYQYHAYGGGWGGMTDNQGNYYIDFRYTLAYYDTAEQQDEMDAAVSALLAQLDLYGKSDYEKICGIYDWMCANITYDHANLEDESYMLMYTAYAALINRTSVCQGYANLFYRLALELGVDNRIISGTGITSTGSGPHAWNIVKLNGSYFDLDVTWDATWKQAGLAYNWFLKCEDNFGTDHVRNDEYNTAAFHAAYPMGEKDYDPMDYVLGSGTCGENLTWVLNVDGTLTISGTGSMDNFEYINNELLMPWCKHVNVINKVLMDDGITSIGEHAFVECMNLVEVVIPDSVKHIGTKAFAGCEKLETLEIPNSITGIGYAAFNGSGIAELTIPASVREIGDMALAGCKSLVSIIVAEDNATYLSENGVLFDRDKTTLICYPAMNTDATYSIPESVETICGHAFDYCNNLEQIFIPDSVNSIGPWAFAFCSSLKEILIPDSVTSIGYTAFSNCTSLEKVIIGNGITDIDIYVFEYCSALTSVTLPDSLVNIWENAFAYCTSLKEITLPAGMQYISDGAFHDCTQLQKIKIGGVQEIWRPFENCVALNEIVFTGDAPTYCENAFTGLSLTAYYPAGNETWTSDVMQDYGGTITWVAYETAAAMVDGVRYDSLTDALTAAESGDVVKLVKDTEEESLTIPAGVTLDLGDHDLTADYIIGFNGSYLKANPNSGKLIVPKGQIILGEDSYVNEKGQSILPIWDVGQGCYLFSQFVVNTDAAKGRGLTINEETEKIYFQFKHQATGALNQGLLANGASDNALSIVIRLEWTNDQGPASQDFYYNDTQIGLATGSKDYTFTLTGYSVLDIDLNTLKVTAMVVTESGATAFGTTWTQNTAK